MRSYKLHIPQGVQDFLPGECYAKRQVENALRKLWRSQGFLEVQSPAFEYLDVFEADKEAMDNSQMFKFTDENGRLLALRPDMTLPIARMAASRMPEAQRPIRLFYLDNVFKFSAASSGDFRESAQAGVELLGACCAAADAEVIASAIDALLCAGVSDFQIELGQVAFFKGLMKQAGLDNGQAESVRVLVEEKNAVALELLMRKMRLPDEARDCIMHLPGLYGGLEVLEEARNMSGDPLCVQAIDNLQEIHDILCDIGFGKFISFDLGMLHQINYYTGVIFRGLSPQVGYPLLSGGRYDRLLRYYGQDMPATGFALRLKTVLIALEKQRGLPKMPACAYMVGFESGARPAAFERMRHLRRQGHVVTQFLGGDAREFEQAVKSGAAQRGEYFKNDGTVVCFQKEENR
ncbi:MAG: ATP phosphoribosyltransferase regulatory subunit [Christensenellales bacterium]|jgi:ATP phosphoribosyltransferase regulatory subunit